MKNPYRYSDLEAQGVSAPLQGSKKRPAAYAFRWKRLLLLLALCTILWALRALPEGDIPTGAAEPEHIVWVDMRALNVTLYKGKEQLGRWPIAIGKSDTPTPIGVYRINRRFKPQEPSPFGTHFLGLNVPWGTYGIHGTDTPSSIGNHASHGCIRMFSKDVEKLYKLTPNWTPVVIEDGPYGQLGYGPKALAFGDRDSQVVVAQKRLWQLGYYHGGFDGVYGPAMSNALKNFRKDHGLAQTEGVDASAWDAMGVFLFE